MAKLLKLRRGTTTQHGSFTGAEGEVTVDTTKDTLVVHDGSQAGGRPLLREDMSNLPAGTIDNADVSNSAAIAGTKVSPDFGSQTITTTGHITLPDQSTGSGKIMFGANNDLQIYHDGNNNYIFGNNQKTLIQNTANNIHLQAKSGEGGIDVLPNANTKLYFDGSKKLETTTGGVNITGELNVTTKVAYPDNAKAIFGTGDDLQIYHDGTHSHITNATNDLNISCATSDADLIIKAKKVSLKDLNNNFLLRGETDGEVKLYHNNSKKFETTSTGVQVTGNIDIDGNIDAADGSKLKLGTGDDFIIYHDGTYNRIAANAQVFLQNKAANETYIAAYENGAVELYYDNAKKFQTLTNGVQITGNCDINGGALILEDNQPAYFGYGNDLQIVHDGSNSYIKEAGVGDLFIRNGFDDAIRCRTDAAVELYHDNVKKFETSSSGIHVTGDVSITGDYLADDNEKIKFGDSFDLQIYHDGTNSYIQHGTVGNLRYQSGNHDFYNQAGNEFLCRMFQNGGVELYYDSSKKIETTSNGLTIAANADLRFTNGSWTGETCKIQHNSNYLYIQGGTSGHILRNNGGADNLTIDNNGNGTFRANVTAYSDARLKTNVNTINDALSMVGKLRGVSFDWKESGKHSIGVIAQEVEEVIPEVVLTNVNTNPATGIEKEVKSVDYGKIVGVLINAINELKAEVDELKGGK